MIDRFLRLTGWKVFAGFIAVVFLQGCGIVGIPTWGKVVEVKDPTKPPTADNIRPIPNAYVVVYWDGITFHIVDSASYCMRAVLTRTDENGDFSAGPWIGIPKGLIFGIGGTSFGPYIPGYVPHERFNVGSERIIYLVKRNDTDAERLAAIGRKIGIRCDFVSQDKLDREFFPLYQAIYEETKTLSHEQGDGPRRWQSILSSFRDHAPEVLPPELREGTQQKK